MKLPIAFITVMTICTASGFAQTQTQQSKLFTVMSPAFEDGAILPQKYASAVIGDQKCGGQNLSPPLAWSNSPPGTKSFAVIVFDPDGQKGLGGNIHWVAYDIAPDKTSLAEGEGSKPPTTFVGGMNGRKLNVYFGPCAPATEQPHHYLFSVFALDIPVGQLGPGLTRDELIAKMRDHVLGMGSVTARFSRGLY